MAKNRLDQEDRVLGEAWQGWKPGKGEEVHPLPGKRMYLLLVFLVFCGWVGLVWGLWFLGSPRLSQIHPRIPEVMARFFLFLMAGIGAYGAGVFFSLLTRRNLGINPRKVGLLLASFFPFCQRLGRRFGIEKDRLAHSFVRVINTLQWLTPWVFCPSDLLILLPRCLDPTLQNPIRSLSEKQGIPVCIVPGGESAREAIRRIQPKAVIGVACERDLIDGVRDVLPMLPVFSIPNQRPEGPCKNTRLDLGLLEEALRCFLGRSVHIPLHSEDG